MRPLSLPSVLPRYPLTVITIIAILIGLRLLLTGLADLYGYSLPIVGGWLKSLEIMEILNIPVFVLLGLGLGAACWHLPSKTALGWKCLALVLAFPLVFFSSYAFRYHLWLAHLINQPGTGASSQEVVRLSNLALQQESGHQGFWGYYCTTVKMPVLPDTVADLRRMTTEQQWFRSELTRFSGVEPGIFSLIFTGAGWAIRVFYLLVALLTSVIYFFKGLSWVGLQRLQRLVHPRP
ncbi:MAG: hypothetical protein KGQ93_12095 [Cyanobacteria bacterium REEB459]|nr:hypothetical protein [Cyanobacteria bacterium REEB459]